MTSTPIPAGRVDDAPFTGPFAVLSVSAVDRTVLSYRVIDAERLTIADRLSKEQAQFVCDRLNATPAAELGTGDVRTEFEAAYARLFPGDLSDRWLFKRREINNDGRPDVAVGDYWLRKIQQSWALWQAARALPSMAEGFNAGIEAAAKILDEAAERQGRLAEECASKGSHDISDRHADSQNVRRYYAHCIRSLAQPSASTAAGDGLTAEERSTIKRIKIGIPHCQIGYARDYVRDLLAIIDRLTKPVPAPMVKESER